MEKNIELTELTDYLNILYKFESYISSIANQIVKKLNQNKKYDKEWKNDKIKYNENQILFKSFNGLYLTYGTDEKAIYIGLNPNCAQDGFINQQISLNKREQQEVFNCCFAIDIESSKIHVPITWENYISDQEEFNGDKNYHYFGFKDQDNVINDAVKIIEEYYTPNNNDENL